MSPTGDALLRGGWRPLPPRADCFLFREPNPARLPPQPPRLHRGQPGSRPKPQVLLFKHQPFQEPAPGTPGGYRTQTATGPSHGGHHTAVITLWSCPSRLSQLTRVLLY